MSHLVEVYAKDLGVKIGDPIFKPHFYPILEDNYITIHTDNKVPAKEYDYWEEVILIVKKELPEIKFIQIGSGKEPRIKTADKFLKTESIKLTSVTLTDRQLSDLELILNGGFNPLKSYLNKKDYDSVLKNMRLASGELWPIPINLDLSKEFIEENNLKENIDISLRDKEGCIIAILNISEIWKVDKYREAKSVYGTTDEYHPGVYQLFNSTNDYYISGKIKHSQFPHHYDFQLLRHTPQELKQEFHKNQIIFYKFSNFKYE